MPNLLRWPTEFADPTPVVGMIAEPLAEFMRDMVERGASVTADETWMSFGFELNSRSIVFVRRGSSSTPRSHHRPRQLFWEVILLDQGDCQKLGTYFGIHGSACVVISRIDDIRFVTKKWLDGNSLDQTVIGAMFWERTKPETPLVKQSGSDEKLIDKMEMSDEQEIALRMRVERHAELEVAGDVMALYEFIDPAIRKSRAETYDFEPELTIKQIGEFVQLINSATINTVEVAGFTIDGGPDRGHRPVAIALTEIRYNDGPTPKKYRTPWILDDGEWYTRAITKTKWPVESIDRPEPDGMT